MSDVMSKHDLHRLVRHLGGCARGVMYVRNHPSAFAREIYERADANDMMWLARRQGLQTRRASAAARRAASKEPYGAGGHSEPPEDCPACEPKRAASRAAVLALIPWSLMWAAILGARR